MAAIGPAARTLRPATIPRSTGRGPAVVPARPAGRVAGTRVIPPRVPDVRTFMSLGGRPPTVPGTVTASAPRARPFRTAAGSRSGPTTVAPARVPGRPILPDPSLPAMVTAPARVPGRPLVPDPSVRTWTLPPPVVPPGRVPSLPAVTS